MSDDTVRGCVYGLSVGGIIDALCHHPWPFLIVPTLGLLFARTILRREPT
jgi:F0F1-type ATP synthase assembly protein I